MASVESVIQSMYSSQLRANNSSSLNMDDFLVLLAAQMSNQDMMNPMSDTEFMGQLAQFTTLQAIQELTELNTTQYAVGLVGQEVTVATLLSNGSLFVETGTVTGVGLFNGEPMIYIGENSYPLSSIMAIGSMPLGTGDEDGGDTGGVEDGGDGTEGVAPGDEENNETGEG